MRSPSYEQALKKLGVKFEYVEDIGLDQINHTRGKQMQARLVPIDQELINSYHEMRVEGFEPPALVLWKPGRGLYIPLDGNQRIEANRMALKKYQTLFSAYVVDTDDPMVADRICWQFNNMVNGRRLSYEESLEHALTFCRKYNQSSSKVAKDWGVKDWELKSRLREAEVRDLAGSKKVDLSNVARATVIELGSLESLGEDLLIYSAKIVAETGVGATEVRQLNADVRKARNHEDKLKVIEDFANSERVNQIKAETKGGRVKKSRKGLPREQLQHQLDQLERLLDEFEDTAFKPVGKENRSDYSATALKVANRLIGVYGLGSYLKGQGVA